MNSGVSTELLAQLRVASEAINKATDDFNAQIKAIEESLASYNIGINQWVKAFEETDEEYDREGEVRGIIITKYFLGYQKAGGKWSLVLASECDYGRDPNDPDRTEWIFRDAPRHLRVKAMAAIPALIQALITAANLMTVELINNAMDARKLAESIKPKGQ